MEVNCGKLNVPGIELKSSGLVARALTPSKPPVSGPSPISYSNNAWRLLINFVSLALA